MHYSYPPQLEKLLRVYMPEMAKMIKNKDESANGPTQFNMGRIEMRKNSNIINEIQNKSQQNKK